MKCDNNNIQKHILCMFEELGVANDPIFRLQLSEV